MQNVHPFDLEALFEFTAYPVQANKVNIVSTNYSATLFLFIPVATTCHESRYRVRVSVI